MGKISKKEKDILLILVIIFLVLSCALVSSSASAYLTSSDSERSSMEVGNLESPIVETWNPPEKIEAGNDYEKVVSISNAGNIGCFVRAFVEFEEPSMASAIDIDFNTTDWTEKQEDGYYYYKSILNSGESTVPLFTTLSAKSDLSDMKLIVYSETVQADGFDNAIDAFSSYN